MSNSNKKIHHGDTESTEKRKIDQAFCTIVNPPFSILGFSLLRVLRVSVVNLILICAVPALADNPPPFLFGGDISALPDLEKAGAKYHDGTPTTDAIAILHNHGANLFRVRLFVNPSKSNGRNAGGATQDLPMVLALAKRIKNAGAKFSLALHYSDTWADPAKQFKPADWQNLPMDALTKKVTDYTVEVMTAMKANGTVPDIVEVGNETTNGMLWPDGKLDGKTPAEKDQKWDNYATLVAAGIRGVRSQSPVDQTKILIHIDHGGRGSVATWFFTRLKKYNPDFDIIGLSFYPTWGDGMPELKKNLEALPAFGKDILVIETGYPYRQVKPTTQATWPMTSAGQKQFTDELIAAIKAAPDHRGIGAVWWYPEAQPLANHRIWENGSLGLFDADGNLLPAANPFLR